MTTTTPYLVRIDSPVGELRLVATASALIAVLWSEERDGRVRFPIEPVDGSNAILDRTATQLREYFEGTRRTFDVPLELRGTDFQQSVWLALAEIPFAETSTYSKQAAAVGRPRATRAVGSANGRN
ncbi:MAG: methylated-DNA--[protein]-cysteine S-methyltransferase, partial [Acidimicrobiaceae bacterium]|nr:methylated-DNA--[protein]-cysteine S-methyltransferase [Acidimicrobiaceae bacterium]